MDYSLAKKLKEAGFPQHSEEELTDEAWVYKPTLSELISECGEGFNSLTLNDFFATDTKWKATDNIGIRFYGETPEIVVANLWLNLKKKG